MVTIESNVEEVIDSIDDVKDDLRHEFRKRVGRAMAMLQQRAKTYVQRDADNTGALHRSIKRRTKIETNGIRFSVFTDSGIAPYAALVEYGTGEHGQKERMWRNSAKSVGVANKPPNWPYDGPDVDTPPEGDLFNLSGYASFASLVSIIQTWMETKPVIPRRGDVFTSAVLISRSIVEKGTYGHPFMRPAWFDSELRIKKAAANALRNAVR